MATAVAAAVATAWKEYAEDGQKAGASGGPGPSPQGKLDST